MFKKFIRKIIPVRWRRIILKPYICSSEYKRLIEESELIFLSRHQEKMHDSQEWQLMELRKACHIIDKGLQRQDLKPGHSKEYYEKALDILEKLDHAAIQNDEDFLWAREVINYYEDVQKGNISKPRSAEFLSSAISSSDLEILIKSRRSIRAFKEGAIDLADIYEIASITAHASHSCNRQTIKTYIVTDENKIKDCLRLNNGATGLSGPIKAFFCFTSDMRAYDMPKEILLPTLDASLGVQNACLLASSKSLGMTLMNWSHASEQQEFELRKLLNIPKHNRIIVNAVLGIPNYGAPEPKRKKIESRFINSR